MYILEVCSGCRKNVIISLIEPKDLRILTQKRYAFTWKFLKDTCAIYKLFIKGEGDILGVMALIDFPSEKRIEIKLLANSKENKGRNKRYDRIAGCLIGYACNLAVKKYRLEACVSLVPKTVLVRHYMDKYYMQNAGWKLYINDHQLEKILKEYYELQKT
jgi:hypothetical protein